VLAVFPVNLYASSMLILHLRFGVPYGRGCVERHFRPAGFWCHVC